MNRRGCRLFGMLYVPAQPVSHRVGVIISVNAIKYRVGTFRLHVALARKLCELGYSVFSFDPEGIGDSEGDFDHKLLSEHYYDIQTGKYNTDLSDAVGFFAAECGLDSLVLFGLCGGAISVLMEAAADSRVKGLILLNIPVLVEDLKKQGQPDHAGKITSTHSASALLKNKLKRLVDVEFWRKLARLQVDFKEESRLVRRAGFVLASKSWSKISSVLTAKRDSLDVMLPVSTNRLFNLHFQQAFFRTMAEDKRILFVFAEFDAWTWIFKSEFQDLVLGPGNKFERRYDIELLPSANHIFSGRDSQTRLEQCVAGWLQRLFPARQVPSPGIHAPMESAELAVARAPTSDDAQLCVKRR